LIDLDFGVYLGTGSRIRASVLRSRARRQCGESPCTQ